MAGRIRTIKPELLEDAVSAGLSDMAFRIFISTILLADDYGRLRAETGWLMGQIYWARSVQVEDFIAAIAELERLVQIYEVNGQRYASIRNWGKHQKVSHPGKPRIPEPPESLSISSGNTPESLTKNRTETRENTSLRKPSGESHETLVPDLRSPITDQGPPTTTTTSPRSAPEDPPVGGLIEIPSDKSPPSWWGDACDTVEAQTGVSLNRGMSWLRYYGHRATTGKRIAKPDAVYWLTTVDVREAQKDREERRRHAERDAKFAARAGPAVGVEPEAPTPEEARANAERLAERIAARKARESKGAA